MTENIFNSANNSIIFDNGELIVIQGDKVRYLKANNLLDLVRLHFYMEEMNIGENDRENLTKVVLDLYDEWKKEILSSLDMAKKIVSLC